MFQSLEDTSLENGSTQQEKTFLLEVQFFPGRGDPFIKGGKRKEIIEVLHREVNPFIFIVFIRNTLAMTDLLLFSPKRRPPPPFAKCKALGAFNRINTVKYQQREVFSCTKKFIFKFIILH